MATEVEVTGVNTVLVPNLSSLSRYLVSVQSQYPQGLSAALTSNVTTLRVPAPTDLRVTNFSGGELTLHWEPAADDAISYLIKWISLSGGGDLRQPGGPANKESPGIIPFLQGGACASAHPTPNLYETRYIPACGSGVKAIGGISTGIAFFSGGPYFARRTGNQSD
ncbi:unnamed protein product [Arctogadus glacialis]